MKGFIFVFLPLVLMVLITVVIVNAQTEIAYVELDKRIDYDYYLEVSQGNIKDVIALNKFGRATDVDQENTDIWDRANGVQGQKLWLKPNASRYHSIVSSSALDIDGGDGSHNMTIFGLTDWDSTETSEIITLNGTTIVNTSNSYVIINRMRIEGGSTNVGYITATAQTDGTVTAQINPTQGQTQMAIYGIPSNYCGYMDSFYFAVLRSAGSGTIDANIITNSQPENNLNNYIVKQTTSVSSGTPFEHEYIPPNTFCGPVIIKLSAIGSTTNLDVSGGFDLVLIPK